jgi:phage/plasmid-like protein (TIGR03299 family)
MAHDLVENAAGEFAFAYVGEHAWHGLGQKLPEGTPLCDWVQPAGYDFEVKRARVQYGNPAAPRYFEDKHVLFRSDNKAPLSVVGKSFKIHQPREILDTFGDLINGAGFTMETAGVIDEGRKFWAMARIGSNAVIKSKADGVSGFLLLASSCDGSMATTGKFTTVRTVCANTLGMALSERGRTTVKATHRSAFNPESMKDKLGIGRDMFGEWVKTMRLLAEESFSYSEAEQMTFALMTGNDWDKASVEQIDTTKDTAGFKKVMELFNGDAKGYGMEGTANTKWGYLNSVTEYLDHFIRARNDENRFVSAQFGAGEKMKTQALQLLTV